MKKVLTSKKCCKPTRLKYNQNEEIEISRNWK